MFGCIGKDEKQWGLKSLKDCVEVNPQKSKDPLILSNSIEEVSFVPMAFVGENGSIDCSCIKNYDEVKSGFTYFKENDVLFAKITPCMENGKGCIAKGLHNGIGFGSTEFHVLRPLDNLCNPKWLYYVSTSQEMRRSAEKKMTGSAGQRRVPAKFLEDFKISIPPIELQKQFATFVSQVDKSKFLLQQMIAKLELLKKSRFIEMFGNPIVNEKKWKVVLLDDACEGIGDGLHGTPKYDDLGDYPFINGNNLIDGVIKITTSTRMVNEETYKKHYTNINNNAILISINGTLGKLAFYNGEKLMLGKSACYCNLKSNINRDFVYSVMKTEAFAGYLDSNSTSSTIKNIGLKAMRAFRLIQPPSKMQIEYVDFAKQIDKSKFLLQQMIAKLELLKKSRFIEMFKNSQKVNLKDVSEITMGQSPDSITYNTEKDGLPFFQGKTEFKEKYIGTPSVWCNAPKKIANSNDILMSVRAPVGDVNITLEKCCIGRGLASIRAKNISTEYLFFALSLLKDEIESKGVGSIFKAINKDIIESIQIPSVDKKLQNDFSEFFIQIDKSKAILQKQLDDLVGSNK